MRVAGMAIVDSIDHESGVSKVTLDPALFRSKGSQPLGTRRPIRKERDPSVLDFREFKREASATPTPRPNRDIPTTEIFPQKGSTGGGDQPPPRRSRTGYSSTP